MQVFAALTADPTAPEMTTFLSEFLVGTSLLPSALFLIRMALGYSELEEADITEIINLVEWEASRAPSSR